MKIEKNKDMIFREDEEGGGALFNVESGDIFDLNATGVDIWNLLDEHEFEEVLSILQENYEADADQLRQDTVEFMKELEERNIVKIIE